MKQLGTKIIDFLLMILGSLLLFMIFTGGVLLKFEKAKIEISSLLPWMAGFLFLVFVRFLVYKNPPPQWIWIERKINFFLESRETKKQSLILFLLYFGVLLVGHVFKHWNFKTFAFDMTFLHQALFFPFGDPLLKCDLCSKGSYLVEHVALSLYLVAPITRFLHSDEFIFFLQVLVVAVPLFLLVIEGPLKTNKKIWFIVFVIILCSEPLRLTLVWDFREDHVAFGAICLSLLFLFHAKVWAYLLFLFLAMLSKENIPFVTLFLSIPIWFDRSLKLTEKQRKVASIGTALLSFGWILVLFKWLIPLLTIGRENKNNIVGRFPEFGNTPTEVVLTLLSSPIRLWNLFQTQFLRFSVLKYVCILILPFISFLRGSALLWLVPFLPGLAMNVLSLAQTQLMFNFHYQLILLPFILFSFLMGINQYKKPIRWVIPLTLALLISGRWPGWHITQNIPTLNNIKTSFYLRSLPSHGTIASSHYALAHLSHFKNLQHLVIPSADVQFPSDKDEAWKILGDWNWNKKPFNQMVIDHQSWYDSEKVWIDFLLKEAPLRGWDQISVSPNNRFVYFTLKTQ